MKATLIAQVVTVRSHKRRLNVGSSIPKRSPTANTTGDVGFNAGLLFYAAILSAQNWIPFSEALKRIANDI